MNIEKWPGLAGMLLVTLSLVLSACTVSGSKTADASGGQVQQVGQSGLETGGNAPSSAKIGTSASNYQKMDQTPAVLQQSEPVKVNNVLSNYDIPVIDFINDKIGFAIKEKYAKSLSLISTQDGGGHWAEKKLPGQFVRSLDFIDANTGWLLIEEGCTTNGTTTCQKIRLLHTQNAGSTWSTQWEAGLKEDRSSGFGNLRRLSFQDAKNGVMLVNSRLYITHDGGVHLNAVNFGLNDFTPLYMSFPKGGTGYVVGAAGKDASKLIVVKTTNGGRTWQKQLSVQATDSPLSSLGIHFADENTGWLLTDETGMLSGEIYRTQDGGKHWNKMSQQRTGRPTPTDIALSDANTGMISLHPGAGPIEGGIWLTKDGGRSFASVAPNHVTAVNQLQMLSTEQIWAAADNINGSGYLLHSSDGGQTWQQSYPTAFPLAQPTQDISMIDAANGFAIGTELDNNQVLQTNDGGDTWKIIASLKGYIFLEKISFIDQQEGWVIAYREDEPHRVLLHTEDGGKTWSSESEKVLTELSDPYNIAFFRYFDRSHAVMFTNEVDKNIWQSSDGGATWTKTKVGEGGGLMMQAFFTSPTNGWLLKEGDKATSSSLSHITDGKHAQTVLTLPSNWLPEAIHFPDENHGFMIMEDFKAVDGAVMHLLTTSDGGKSWADHPFPKDTDFSSVKGLYFADPTHGWLTFTMGTIETKDGGLSWTVMQ